MGRLNTSAVTLPARCKLSLAFRSSPRSVDRSQPIFCSTMGRERAFSCMIPLPLDLPLPSFGHTTMITITLDDVWRVASQEQVIR